MTNYSLGHSAEKQAAVYLMSQGFRLKEMNWKTRWCEIDIVAEKGKTIYFVEVKSRSNLDHGGGLDYITSQKLKQMEFAANLWVSQNDWDGDCQLAVIAIDGNEIEFIDDLYF
jgi:uncharacterized protein (TIGR00252 family)